MRQVFQKWTLTASMVCGGVLAHAGVLPGPLVDTTWLSANLDKVQIVEVRGNVKSFTAQPEIETDAKTGKKTVAEIGGHIPGSRLIDMKTMRTDRMIGDLKVKYMIPTMADFQATIQAAGVDADKPVVLVPVGMDVTDVDDALRVHWQLKTYGEDNLAVLDGGMATWLIENRPFSTDAAPAKVGTWVAKADRTVQFMATSDDVAQAIAAKGATLIDSRDIKQYHGLGKRDYVFAYGHLEGAKLYSPDLMVKSAGGAVKFMSPNTYKALLTAQGIDPAAPSISYCNSGHLSSGPWFIMNELVGAPKAKLYDGSLHEWTLEKHTLAGAVPQN
jgi:thiosulfate/3-mercaptopyruvate sulfurtransferase